jgi:5-methylcytosine-specific restriction endonuclease McrA
MTWEDPISPIGKEILPMVGGVATFDALLLTADYRLVSLPPLSVWPWQEAIRLLLGDRAVRAASYERVARSPSTEVVLPSVMALKEWRRRPGRPPFTRYNLYLRDRFTCQYCAATPGSDSLTIDHVVSRVQGGKTLWENAVACCIPCNTRKSGRTPAPAGLRLLKEPRLPGWEQLARQHRTYPKGFLHESWIDYLYWDTDLEP